MLEVHGLSHRYGNNNALALDDVSLKAERGRVLGLLGPNGAGKSTLASYLAGTIPVTQGEIRIDGRSLRDIRRVDPTRIAVASQDLAVYPSLTVRENLECFAAANRLSRQAAREAVNRCLESGRLVDHSNRLAAHLSGGYRRRLNFAIALLAEPDYIVLDEPTAGVDPESRRFLLDAVRSLAQQDVAVIYTSHYLEEIESIGDDVAILHHGRVLLNDPLEDLLDCDNDQLIVTLLAAPPRELLTRLAELGSVEQHRNLLVITVSPDSRVAQIIDLLEVADIQVRDLHWGRTRLEHVFMQLTGDDACSPR